MKVSVSTRLDVDIDQAWEMLHTPAVFRAVSSPFTVFRDTAEAPLPERFSPDTDYLVTVSAGGLIPLGTQIIRLADTVTSWAERETCDTGRGVSGMLRMMTGWNHRMSLEAAPDGTTFFRDRLSVDASWLSPLMWPAFAVFWRWRALRLRQLAKKRSSDQQRFWDGRYGANQRLWSGEVNPFVESVASERSPGRALDIGAGEGGDVLWLAEGGWSVHAVDTSGVAIFRGYREAALRHKKTGRRLDISWQVADVTSDPLPDEKFDLVSIQYFHLSLEDRERVWRKAMAVVDTGGRLVIVGHSVKDSDAGVKRPPRELLFDESVFDAVDPPDWSEWSVSDHQRLTTHRGEPVTVWDVVLVATR